MKRRLVTAAVLLGLALAVLAVVYLLFPANELPSVIPGHAEDVTRHRLKWGVTSGLGSFALLVWAWVQVEAPGGAEPAEPPAR